MALTYPPETILHLRQLIGDDTEPYTFQDATLDAWLVEAEGNVRKAASNFWYMKATKHAESVDITEAGSSRKNSDLFKNAFALAKQYDDSDGEEPTEATSSTTRRIVRR
jgi:hypothetical protein